MTLEELLNADAAKLESFSDAELQAYFEPMLKVTRPEFANPGRETRKFNGSNPMNYQQSLDFKTKAALAMDMAAKMGIKLKL